MTRANPASFADVVPIWQASLTIPNLTLTFPNDGKATYIQQRCYRYRRALQSTLAEQTSIPGYFPTTPYDHLKIVRDGAQLIFTTLGLPEFTATDAAGNPVDVAAVQPPPLDMPL